MSKKINDGLGARKRYENKLKKICLEFNIERDQDILSFLESKSNKAGYTKGLIRDAMLKENNGWQIWIQIIS